MLTDNIRNAMVYDPVTHRMASNRNRRQLVVRQLARQLGIGLYVPHRQLPGANAHLIYGVRPKLRPTVAAPKVKAEPRRQVSERVQTAAIETPKVAAADSRSVAVADSFYLKLCGNEQLLLVDSIPVGWKGSEPLWQKKLGSLLNNLKLGQNNFQPLELRWPPAELRRIKFADNKKSAAEYLAVKIAKYLTGQSRIRYLLLSGVAADRSQQPFWCRLLIDKINAERSFITEVSLSQTLSVEEGRQNTKKFWDQLAGLRQALQDQTTDRRSDSGGAAQ